MGLLNALRGHASDMDLTDVAKQLDPIIIDGEEAQQAFKVFRDVFVFTNKRLILIDKQGLTGKKVAFHSIPYESVEHFSIETAGTLDLDSELKIYVRGMAEPISKEFGRSTDIKGVARMLASHIL